MQLIAIDGPGGSGKSTVAKALALRLGMERLDTGAMYRAVALLAIRADADLRDGALLGRLAQAMELEVNERVILQGEDISTEIRSEEVDSAVSLVSRHPEVRSELVKRQRDWARQHGGGIVEGRDIGSVVFPEAKVKVFLTASTHERAARRALQKQAKGVADPATVRATRESIERRDEIDSKRDDSPLKVADGAVVIDSTGQAVTEVVDKIVSLL